MSNLNRESPFIKEGLPSRILDVDVVNELLLHMEFHNGSDLFFMGGEYIWMDRYGRKERVSNRKLQDKEVVGILAMIYGDNAESRLGGGERVDTSHDFKILVGRDEHDNELYDRSRFRVNGVSCLRNGSRSATITIRSIPTTPPSMDSIGVEQDIKDVFMKTAQGLALVVGATGNGKSTLLAALLRGMMEDENGHRNLVTIEAPIEFVHDGYYRPNSIYTQMEVGKNIPSFHEGVVNAMRMKPTSILVGETRDLETVKASLEASNTGHFVASTVHSNSVDSTFQRLITLYPEELQAQAKAEFAESLKLVVAQRLLPTVDGKRTAIRSYLAVDQYVKNQLLNAKNVSMKAFELMEAGHGKPMMEDVETKYRDGLISRSIYDEQKYNYGTVKDMYK